MGSRPLRQALLERWPWLGEVDVGPQAVTAGECDRCQAEARLVAPCGPPPRLAVAASPDWGLGRRCTIELGDAVWCNGHLDEGAQVRTWLARLPEEADDVARLWWVATGEVRLDPELVRDLTVRLGLPASTA